MPTFLSNYYSLFCRKKFALSIIKGCFLRKSNTSEERLKSLYVPRVQEEAGEATVVPGWPVPMFASTWCWTVGRYHIHTHKFIDQYVIVEAAGCRQASCVHVSIVHTYTRTTNKLSGTSWSI